ncbi:MAG TPA: hypothetical protein VLN44_13065 [Pyrinomonadaceae bacterium]|nr:hypothetical protein [Pyrinomonadaceae bacterium]
MFKAARAQNGNAFKPQSSAILNLVDRRSVRECLIFIAFCLFTSVMTWPWVLHLRDAVADRGDPYMIAWTLWWDYHQTFHNPLHLFDANVFYPYQSTLAFSENDYGIAILFFPLFAAGLKPLTINSIATFLGFAFCGYGAFRLTRTLTGRNGPAWIAGIVFAFIPFRFHLLSHLHYLFAGWIPLMLESLVLFARRSTWQRATWMGIAFFMNGLSCISWLIMTIVPLALTVLFFVIAQKSLRRSRPFWVRGAVAVALASLALFPFLWPYYKVSVLYGFRWQPWEFAVNSASLMDWFKAEPRNKIWQNFGVKIPGGYMLFPGLLAPLLAVASLQLRNQISRRQIERRFIMLLNFVIVAAAVVATLAIGYGDTTYRIFGHRLFRLNDRSIKHALVIILIALVLRMGLALPSLLRRFRNKHRPQMRINTSEHTIESIGVGVVWTVAGLLSSLGANFFVNRWLHDYLFLYQSIRIPARAAMICYLGLAVLAGIGASRLASRAQQLFSHRRVQAAALVLMGLAILFELNASPLKIESGEVDPSSLSLYLRQTPMNGGLVELPSSEADVSRHFYMLRAADHGRPLVNATSSFISPLTDQINKATEGKIGPHFMDLLEKIPASYLVVHNDRLLPGWQTEYEIFLARSLVSGRLRFINRFDGHDDLYAVVRTEPNAKSEAPAPFPLIEHEWSVMIDKDESNILSPATRSQSLYRLYLATTGTLPRYADFMKDIKTIGRGVIRESENEDRVFQNNLSQFADNWVLHEPVAKSFRHLDDAQYVDRLLANAGIALDPHERSALVDELAGKSQTRAAILLRIVADRRFVDQENARSLVLLHYFAYLHRNPGDAPDRDLSGFNFWIQDFAKQPDAARLSAAFQNSIEYWRNKEGK